MIIRTIICFTVISIFIDKTSALFFLKKFKGPNQTNWPNRPNRPNSNNCPCNCRPNWPNRPNVPTTSTPWIIKPIQTTESPAPVPVSPQNWKYGIKNTKNVGDFRPFTPSQSYVSASQIAFQGVKNRPNRPINRPTVVTVASPITTIRPVPKGTLLQNVPIFVLLLRKSC